MSDKTGEARSTRGGPGRILGGLAATAMLGAPGVLAAAPAAAAPAAEQPAVSAKCSIRTEAGSIGSSFRDQFRDSFTPGVVIESAADAPAIICDDGAV